MSKADRSAVLTARAIETLQAHPLSKVEAMVLWHLVANLPMMGEVVAHSDLETKLGVTRLGPIVARLCKLGFLLRGSKTGVSYHYKLNPALFRILL